MKTHALEKKKPKAQGFKLVKGVKQMVGIPSAKWLC